jgi:hypothetical protein
VNNSVVEITRRDPMDNPAIDVTGPTIEKDLAHLNAPPHYQIVPNPLPLVLNCPSCGFPHVDNEYWRKRLHKTHLCASCRFEWQPSIFNTVGVDSMP